MSGEVKSKGDQPIEEGDHVFTKIRGGRHEGDVSGKFYFPSFLFHLDRFGLTIWKFKGGESNHVPRGGGEYGGQRG